MSNVIYSLEKKSILPPGAIAGIAVGGFIVVAILIYCIIARRRKLK